MLIEFCLPVYNEEKILKENTLILHQFLRARKFNFDWKIVIITNGCIDNSNQIAKRLSDEFEEIKVVKIEEAGKGKALKKYAMESKSDIYVYMDIDLAVSLGNLADLVIPIVNNEADLVIGSRLLPDSKVNRSFYRDLSSRVYNLLSRLILGYKFSDLQCGFKAIKTDVFKKISPFIKDDKWFFDTELIAWAKLFNYRIKEIPVDWSENRYEKRKSKIKLLRDSFKFLISLIKLKIRLIQSCK